MEMIRRPSYPGKSSIHIGLSHMMRYMIHSRLQVGQRLPIMIV
jgi:hypothetical protein